MKFLLVAALFAGALAVPTGGGDGGGDHSPSPFCPFGGLFGNAQCCATDILGIADLDCQTRELEALAPMDRLDTRCSIPDSSQPVEFQDHLRRKGPASPLLRPPAGKSSRIPHDAESGDSLR